MNEAFAGILVCMLMSIGMLAVVEIVCIVSESKRFDKWLNK